ncbi:MAG: hypothetical protein HY735_26025 [Verrucomicrobia bacterium]|nr:hypothetical protein [Verrucomicrobiota bacterium]
MNELIEEVKALPPRQRRKFIESVRKLDPTSATPEPRLPKKAIRWPNAAGRRRKIFGNKVLPNLVLLERNEEHY